VPTTFAPTTFAPTTFVPTTFAYLQFYKDNKAYYLYNTMNELKEFMFTRETIERVNHLYKKGLINNKKENDDKKVNFPKQAPAVQQAQVQQASAVQQVQVQVAPAPTLFTPLQKDKLFWCFYILLHGNHDYEMNKSHSFGIEKKIKISAVEKLASIKDKLKELKIKKTEIEDELVNKECLTIKGLQALCLIHKISIMYISGKKFSEFLYDDQGEITGIIEQLSSKEITLTTVIDNDYIANIKKTYWCIENIQKPLNAPSAYTIKELQDIAKKLGLTLETPLGKNKTKQILYEEILIKI